ncbi:MAG: YczE/YyaS/YitT family protein [Acidimicrobiales bacterium]
MVAGCALATFCYALTIRAGLGLGPLFAVQDGVASRMGISIGSSVMLVGFAFVVLAVAMRSCIGPATVCLPFLGGVLLDLILPHLPTLHGSAVQLVTVVVASWFMGLGGSLVIKGALGAVAYDAVMMGFHRRLRGPIVVIRLAMEGTMLVLGWALGGTIGVGTVITALIIGPSMHLWLQMLGVTRSHDTPMTSSSVLRPPVVLSATPTSRN